MVSKTITAVALGICSALVAASAGAANITWNFTSSTENATNSGAFGNSRSVTSGSITATASAWSNTFNSGNTQIENAYLGLYGGGLGVTNRDGDNQTSGCPGSGGNSNDRCEGTIGNTNSPEHGVDNNERFDSVRIRFGTSQVNLSSLVLGWVPGDADITVLASNGAALDTRTYGNGTGLLAAGWSFIGNYANISEGSTKSIANSTFATDWLIIAYNPAFGNGTNLQSGDDYFKLKIVTGDTRKVPEPGTLLLLGAAALGFWRMRRAG